VAIFTKVTNSTQRKNIPEVIAGGKNFRIALLFRLNKDERFFVRKPERSLEEKKLKLLWAVRRGIS